MTLLRYFSFPNDLLLYPIEMDSKTIDKIMNLWFEKNLAEFQKGSVIHSKNASFLFDLETSLKYLTLLLQNNFRISIKNTNCNANIYIQPSDAMTMPHLYYPNEQLGMALKDPFWIVHDVDYENQNWKQHSINIVPKHSLLMYQTNFSAIRHNYYCKQLWMNAALGYAKIVSKAEKYIVYEMTLNGSSLQLFGPYRNACNHFQMISVKRSVSDFKFNVKYYDGLLAQANPRSVEIFTNAEYTTEFLESMKNGKGSPKTMFKYINNFPIEEHGNFLPHSIDIHALQTLLPSNITLNFKYVTFDESFGLWKAIKVEECSQRKTVLYPAKLLPSLLRNTETKLAAVQEMALVFQNRQLRFVSCHNEQNHWMYRLKELVVAFDLATWALIIISCNLVSMIMSLEIPFRKHNSIEFLNKWFYLFTSLLDQSSSLFQKHNFKAFVFFWPLVCLIISIEYKGDNITKLTLDPELIPFDTFEILVNKSFKIYSRRGLIQPEDMNFMKENAKIQTEFVQENGHEALPIVSEFWHEILKRFPLEELNRMEALKSEIPNKTLLYLNNSEMLPDWQTESGSHGSYESIKQILSMHMEICNKSTMILQDNMAIELFTILKATNKPAFFGKDVLNEILYGYKYFGFFPSSIMTRVKNSFQSGIIEWWQKYFKWVIRIKTQTQERKIKHGTSTKAFVISPNSQTGVYILCLIPCFGLILASLVFVFCECNCIITVKQTCKALLLFLNFINHLGKQLKLYIHLKISKKSTRKAQFTKRSRGGISVVSRIVW